MAEHVAEDFGLDRLAAQAGLSKFNFQPAGVNDTFGKRAE